MIDKNSNPFRLHKAFAPFLETASEYIDPKWSKFKKVINTVYDDDDTSKTTKKELTTQGFIDKYGIDSGSYTSLRWAKKQSLKNIPMWRWTDARLENAIRKLSASTNNAHFTRMLQGQSKTVASLKTRGPITKTPSTTTKLG